MSTNKKSPPKKDKMFEASMSHEKIISRLKPENDPFKRYSQALAFLTHDSDWHMAEAMKNGKAGSEQYATLAAEFSAGAVQWQSQMPLILLAAFNASLIATFMAHREAGETIN